MSVTSMTTAIHGADAMMHQTAPLNTIAESIADDPRHAGPTGPAGLDRGGPGASKGDGHAGGDVSIPERKDNRHLRRLRAGADDASELAPR